MDNIFSIILAIAGLLWFGLLMVAFFGKLIATLVSYISSHKKRWKKEAIEADAVILHVEQTGLYINNKPQVKLQVQVKPGKGRNFVTEINDIENRNIGIKSRLCC